MSQNKDTNRFPSLAHRDFKLLWIGNFISNAGTHMQIVALNWHIYLLTNSALALGLIGLLRFLPIVLFSLIGGTFADAHNRKRIMLIANTVLFLLAGILAITTLHETVNPTIIYIITIAAAIAHSFELPARNALIPSLINKKHLANAMSLNVITWQLAIIVGPSLAGILIGRFGVGSVYVFDTISFIAAIASILLIRHPGNIEQKTSNVSVTAVFEGLKYIKSKTIIWSTMLLDFFSTFFSSATALLPIFARDILNVGPVGLGFLYAAPAIGAVIAGFVVAHMGNFGRQGIILLISIVFYAVGTILFGISTSFWFSIFALMIVGAGDSVSAIIRNVVRQIATPDHIRGRMISVNAIFFIGGPQLGEFEAGVLAALIGAPASVVLGGIGTLIAVGVMAAVIPILRKYDTHESTLDPIIK